MKLLHTVNTCYHHIIKWQPYKPSRKGPTQCYRCMLYGHGISQCMRFAVCSLCSGSHLTNTCTNITQDTPNPVYKCFNCASANLPAHNHKATDPNCPFRAKYEQTMKNVRDNTKNTHTSATVNNQGNTSSGVSSSNRSRNTNNNDYRNRHRYVLAPNPPATPYADAVRTSHSNSQSATTHTQHNNAQNEHISAHQQNGNLWSFAEVADLLLNSINELKQCRTKLDHLKVIANLLQNACN